MKIFILLLLSFIITITLDNLALMPIHADQLPAIKQIYEDRGVQKEVDVSLPSGSKAGIRPGSKGRVYTIDKDDKTEMLIADIEVTRITGDGSARAKRTKGSDTIKIKKGDIVRFETSISSDNTGETSGKNRKDAEACLYRGNTYFEKGDYDQAISEYSKAIELDPKLAVAYYNRGNAYYKKGEYDYAWTDINKAKSLGCEVEPEFLDALRKAVDGR